MISRKYEHISMILMAEALDLAMSLGQGNYISEAQSNTVKSTYNNNYSTYGHLSESWVPEQDIRRLQKHLDEHYTDSLKTTLIPIYGYYCPEGNIKLKFCTIYAINSEGVVAKYDVKYERKNKKQHKYVYVYKEISLVWQKKGSDL